MQNKSTPQQLLAENADLRAKLEKAEQTLREILSGEADALFVSGEGGSQLFTLKGADQSYRTLIENMSEGALTMTAEGVILYANRRFAEMLKMPLEKVIGASIYTWILSGSQPVFQSLLSKGAEENRRAQLELTVSDGTRMPVQLSVSNLRTDETPDAFCLVVTDLSEQMRGEVIAASEKSARELLAAANQSRRELLSLIEDQKQAEESLRQLNEDLENKVIARTSDLEHARLEAEQANHAKSEFLAAMSHEIRTPMNGVIGMVDVLQQSSLNPQQMEMSNIIHDSAYALLAVIDDILDFSKIEAGKLQIEHVPMNIASIVEGVCDALDHIAMNKKVELTLFTDPLLPEQVLGDPGRLRQILINLANNAIKFSSGQGRQARVSVRALPVKTVREPGKPANTATVEFRVTDNGIGIDTETQAKLFTPFTQADTSTTRNFGGTGLGLAICLQLVKINGGAISVQSELGKGAVFIVRLPFDLPTEQIDVGRDSSRQSSVGLKPDLQGLSCLVVGGADSLAGDMAVYLAHDGALVDQAVDSDAARQWIARQPPGLCVTVIDTVGAPLPLVKSLLDNLRAAARAKTDIRFVIIGRGKRRRCRVDFADQVSLDAEVMHRNVFLEAVAVAAGWIKMQELGGVPDNAVKSPEPLSREEARRQGRLILIAEDNDINQKVLMQQLKLLGQTADIVSNGREALERWQSGDYGILITDLHMPEMDGYELTAAMRASEGVANITGKPRTPIIAFTANALKGEAEHCIEVGMDDYLSKPVQLANLKAMLDKWLPVATPDSIAEAVGRVTPAIRATMAGVTRPAKPPATSESIPVDVNVLKKLVGDDAATIRDFLHDFRISAEKIATELRTASAAGDTAAVVAAAHKLKSSARSVGALALGELCADMERAGKAKQTAELAALLPPFEAEISVVNNYLDLL